MAAGRVVFDHAEQFLARLPNGGFTLDAPGCPTIRLRPARDGGWLVEGPAGLEGWLLRRTASAPAGFVLGSADGAIEAGRTMPLVGTAGEAGLKFLLLDDGRLFRIVMCGPREGGFELQGWETPGAYLRAQPQSEGWRLAPTAACGGIEEIHVLSILLAAEVLDAEAPLQ